MVTMKIRILKNFSIFVLALLVIDLVLVYHTGVSYTLQYATPSLGIYKRNWSGVINDSGKERHGRDEDPSDHGNNMTDQTLPEKNTKKVGFQALSTNSVSTLNFICIAPPSVTPTTDIRIHMYNSKTSQNVRVQSYTVKSFHGDPPFEYEMKENVAYFFGYVEPFLPNNFFHFMRQIFFPLHYLTDETNTKNSEHKNHLHLKVPLTKYWRSVYAQHLFPSLNIDAIYGVRHNFTHTQHPGGVCYRKAVFSDNLFSEFAESAIAYFYKFLNVNESLCLKKNSIVLIQRKYNRKLLNMNELVKTALRMRYSNISVIIFEDIPLRKQAMVVYCARILVGVQGAAMSWAYFMRPNSVTIEIAWPHYGWDFFYAAHKSKLENLAKKVTFIPLYTAEVHNVTTCWKGMAKVLALTPAQMSIKPIENIYQSLKHLPLGKSCNVDVDPDDFAFALRTAYRWITING